MTKILALFNETFTALPKLTDMLIATISESWEEPYREQGLRVLNALKSSLDSETELLKTAYVGSEPWAYFKPLKVTFSFEECNVKEGDTVSLQNCVQNLTDKLSSSSSTLDFLTCGCEYTEGYKEATIKIQFRL